MENLTSYFEVLELQPGATHEQIRQAYRDMVNVWHPDRFENNPRLKEKATDKLQRINAAYAKLKNYQPSARTAESGPRHEYRQEHQQTRHQKTRQHTANQHTDSFRPTGKTGSETYQRTTRSNKDTTFRRSWVWPDWSKLTRRFMPSMHHGQIIVVVLALFVLYATGHINVEKIVQFIGKIIICIVYVIAFISSLFRQKPTTK